MNETGETGAGLIITGKHYLLLGSPQVTLEQVRLKQQAIYTSLHPLFHPLDGTNMPPSIPSISYIRNELPVNIELMTLQVLMNSGILIRLSHSFAVNESNLYSQAVTVDLSKIFVRPIQNITQVTLTANNEYTAHISSNTNNNNLPIITIYPMQILAFILYFL